MSSLDGAIRRMLEDYNDLNSEKVDELYEEPSALEFMRYVASNRPFVVRQGASNWGAVQKWSSEYLAESLAGAPVKVAITPHGHADSAIKLSDGSSCFAKPFERMESFESVLRHIQEEELSKSSPQSRNRPVKYCQTQNDNLRNEYVELFKDVPKDIDFARIALRQQPDAINFWLGSSKSVTDLHKDNYENIYVQVRGQKHFVLLPPLAVPAVNEQILPSATYRTRENRQSSDESDASLSEVNDTLDGLDLVAELDEPAASVPVAMWDPDGQQHCTTFSSILTPLRVTLQESDMLYLPSCWYHKVSQTSGHEDFACAVNYWYDMNFGGSLWPAQTFVREVSQQLGDSRSNGR